MMRRLPRSLALLPVATALALALGALAITAYSSLMAPHAGIPAGEPPLGNLLGAARSYLFRHSLRNTLLVGALVFVAAGIIVRMVLRTAHPTLGRWTVWDALAASPLFLPASAAALLWRPLFAQIDLVRHTDLALVLLAVVSIWRLWPISLFARPLAAHSGATRAALAAALVALWLALIDAASLLLLTGGQPFNATHVWASWAFHTVWVSRLWGHGAVMLGGLAAASALFGGLVFYLAAPIPGPEATATPRTRGQSHFERIGAVLALAPLILHMSGLNVAELGGALAGLARLGYFHWLANTAFVWLLAWLIAAAIASTAPRGGLHRHPRLVWLSVLAGTSAMPLWHFTLAQLPALALNVDSRLLLAGTSGISAGLISLGFVCTGQMAWRHALTPAAIVSALLVLNHFTAEIVLEGSRRAYPLGAGMALYLAENPTLTGERGWALLLTLGLAWIAAYAAGRFCNERRAW